MRGVILLVLIYHVVSQPLSDELSRQPRELIECCPCPGSSDVARSRAVDDCPCRERSADSEGASSMLSSSGHRSNIPFLRSNDPKDDQKNLLEPEVGLATSMLQTLREATEEEYRDALARDAAKVDAVPEESARNMVIIVKPSSRATDNEDSTVGEASNVKETHCVHPLGSALSKMRTTSNPLKVLPDIFRLHKKIWDTDVGASNIRESFMDMDKESFTPQSELRPSLKDDIFKGNDAHSLKAFSTFDKLEESLKGRPNLFERFNLPTIPKLLLEKSLRTAPNGLNNNNDLSPAPNNNQEAQQIDDGESRFNKKPPLLRNLLKLKDVELIPKSILKRPILKSRHNTFSLPTSHNSDNEEDSSYDSATNENVLMPKNVQKVRDDVQLPNEAIKISVSNTVDKSVLDCSTETESIESQDELTSPSEIIPMFEKNATAYDVESVEKDCDNLSSESLESKESQDALTSPSEIIPIFESNAPANEVESDEKNCEELSSEEPQSTKTERINGPEIDETDNETLNPTIETKILNTIENESESNISQECENQNSLEIENDHFNTDSSNLNVITTTQTNNDLEDTIILPEFVDSVEITADSSCNGDDEVASNLSTIDRTQIITPTSLETDKLNIGKSKLVLPLSETLSAFKNNVAKRLEDLKINTINLSSAKLSDTSKVKDKQIKAFDESEELKDDESTEINNSSEENKEQDKSGQVTFKDLEKLSNDLLVLSSKNEQLILRSTPKEEKLQEKPVFSNTQNSDELDFKLNDIQNNENIEAYNLGITPINDLNIVMAEEESIKNLKEEGNRNGFQREPTQKTVQQLEPVSQPEDSKEMVVEASAPIGSTLPAFLDPLNLNKKVKSPVFEDLDTFNLGAKFGRSEIQGVDLNARNINGQLRSPIQDVVTQPTSTQVQKSNIAADSSVVKAGEKSTKSVKENSCRSGFQNELTQKTVQQLKPVSQPEDGKEMVVEASAPIGSTLPAFLDPLNLNEKLKSHVFTDLDPLNLNVNLESPLFENIDLFNLGANLGTPVFQGVDLDPLNLNEKLRSSLQDVVLQPTIPQDPFNLLGKPLKLPTLDDLRQQLTSAFDTNDRSAEDLSEEENQCSNIEMSSAASITNARKVPTVRPLEDFNVDIFQLKPLSSSQSDFSSKFPRLNLNNFRAKLPIPDRLDLKPVKLESRVGNDKGILGASLSFGSDRSKLRKAKPNHLNLLGSRLGSLPAFDELRNNFHSNTQKLLGKSLKPSFDLLSDSPLLTTGLPDVDEVRRNAEKTIKGLQQRMKSTLNGETIGSSLSEKFARPQDLLEDVNDKLKAIHYDLNDRLSSIHENIIDQSRFKPLTGTSRIPTFPTKSTNRHVMHNIRKTKGKPARLQTSPSTLSSQEVDPFIDTRRNSFGSLAKNELKKDQTNTHKTLFGAESSPVPTKVEFPQPRSSNDISRKLLSPLLEQPLTLKQDAENIFPQSFRDRSLTKNPNFTTNLKRPTFRKPNPFKDKTSKVTITFATTTVSPVSPPSEEVPIKLDDLAITRKSFGKSLKEKLANHRRKLQGDTKQTHSESASSRITAPLKSKNNFKTANSDIIDYPQLQSLKSSDIKSRLSAFKDKKDSKIKGNINGVFDTNQQGKNVEVTAQKPKSLVWPKSGEDSFLAKVREAMQARLASFEPANAAKSKMESSNMKAPAKVETVKNVNTDMEKSASENNGMILIEPLKESVSFKCKMVCTREK